MRKFLLGINYSISGFKLIFKPGIRIYVIIPLLINSILFAGIILSGANTLNRFIDTFLSQWHWLEWLTWLLWPIYLIIALAIVFFLFSVIANFIGAPFNGFLSAAVERSLTGSERKSETKKNYAEVIMLAFKMELQKFSYFIIRALPLLILFLLPIINIAAPFIWLFFTAWMLTIEYGDYPMGNHDISFKVQRERFRLNRQLAYGFGSGVMFLTMVPIINFFAMPVAVAGATRMFIESPELNL